VSTNNEIEQTARKLQFDALMSNRLVARFDLQGELHLESVEGDVLDKETVLKQLKQQNRLQKELSVIWVPSQQVLITDVVVPGKRKAHWMAALPYALEETLTESVDDYHIVVLNRDAQDKVCAAVVSLEDMDKWQKQLSDYGLTHALLVPDCFRLPYQIIGQTGEVDTLHGEKLWAVASIATAEGNLQLVRTSVYQGFVADDDWYPVLKQQFLAGYNLGHSHPVQIKEQPINRQALLSSAQANLSVLTNLSLSQGDYKPISQSKNLWYEWRWTAALVTVLLVVWMANQFIQAQQLNQQAEYTAQQTEVLFKKLFPETKRIVNIKAQTLTKLKGGVTENGQGIELMPVLQTIEPWFAKNKNVKLIELSWTQGNAKHLTLQVRAPKSVDLERIVALSKETNSKLVLSLELKNVTSDLAEGVIYVDAN